MKLHNVYFGKSLQSTGTRLFKDDKHGCRLISWMDKHCIICGRFITKFGKERRCKKCSEKYHNQYYREWKENHKDSQREYHKNYLKRWREKNPYYDRDWVREWRKKKE